MISRGWILRTLWVVGAAIAASQTAVAAQVVYPTDGGTLADGGSMGVFDGLADRAAWSFGLHGFSGAVTLTTESPASTIEHRMVCEYDLRTLDLSPPVQATLNFNTRGVSAWPFPDTTLHVYAYPADLLESMSDYSAPASMFLGAVTVSAMQPAQATQIDISDLVGDTLAGNKRLAVRFQIDPAASQARNQVFIDADDNDVATKPFLMIRGTLIGDADEDGDVDHDDLAIFADCLSGPNASPSPASPAITPIECLWAFDNDGDADVDLVDLMALADLFAEE